MPRGVAAGATAIPVFGLLSTRVSVYRAAGAVKGKFFRCRQALACYDGQRFEKLKADLPARGVVGYFEDETEKVPFSKYSMTQYALAPVLVVPNAEPSFVIGNFVHA